MLVLAVDPEFVFAAVAVTLKNLEASALVNTNTENFKEPTASRLHG